MGVIRLNLIIEDLFEQHKLKSDEQIITELESLPMLPDEDDPIWDNDQPWHSMGLLMALASIAAERKMQSAIPLLLEKTSYGDPGDKMQSLRHRLEAIVDPNWEILVEICMEVANYSQPGARLWAVAELGMLRDSRSLQTLIMALQDPKEMVREEASSSLGMICQTNSECRERVIETLQKYIQRLSPGKEKEMAVKEIEYIKNMDG